MAEQRLGFLYWAMAELERLEGRAHAATDRQARFAFQNRIATLLGVTAEYGRWLRERAEWKEGDRCSAAQAGE